VASVHLHLRAEAPARRLQRRQLTASCHEKAARKSRNLIIQAREGKTAIYRVHPKVTDIAALVTTLQGIVGERFVDPRPAV
jgi:hypothetical protein